MLTLLSLLVISTASGELINHRMQKMAMPITNKFMLCAFFYEPNCNTSWCQDSNVLERIDLQLTICRAMPIDIFAYLTYFIGTQSEYKHGLSKLNSQTMMMTNIIPQCQQGHTVRGT